jgi:hypothetical protein
VQSTKHIFTIQPSVTDNIKSAYFVLNPPGSKDDLFLLGSKRLPLDVVVIDVIWDLHAGNINLGFRRDNDSLGDPVKWEDSQHVWP